MTATLLDISDISIRLWKDGALVCESPSVAHISGANIEFGEQALAKSRNKPQGLYAQHWSAIDTKPLVGTTKIARHNGDLIYRHLADLQEKHNLSNDVVISVPSELNHEQLSLLLGITQSLNFNTVGLVDSAVANVAYEVPEPSLIQFIELGLFRTTVTDISVGQQAVFESVRAIESVGQDYFTNHCLNWVADCFLDQARFDPLHQAQTEQLIFDNLTSWLGALNHSPNINVEIEHLGRKHSVSLSRNALLEALQPGIALIAETIDPDRPVFLSHRFNVYPDEAFTDLADKIAPTRINPTNIFNTIADQLENVLCAAEEITFTRQLNTKALTSPEQADGS